MVYLRFDKYHSECKEEITWTVKGTFTWKTTEVNKTAKHRCPHGPSNVTVTRTCLGESNKTFWGMFDTSSCNQSKHTMTLLELSQVLLILSGLYLVRPNSFLPKIKKA